MSKPSDRTGHVRGFVGPERFILSPDLMRWRVREYSDAYDRRHASLVFDCDDVMRRVRNFPENWRELSDAELFAISLRA